MVIEVAVRAVVVPAPAVGGLPEVTGSVRGSRGVGLLGVEAGAGEVVVQERGGQLVCQDGREGGRADGILLAPGMVGCVDDGAGGDFRLVDGRAPAAGGGAGGTAARKTEGC